MIDEQCLCVSYESYERAGSTQWNDCIIRNEKLLTIMSAITKHSGRATLDPPSPT